MVVDWFGTVVALIFGTVVGSFLNVCIYRIPAGKSIISPGSFCPKCGTSLRPRDLVPLLSFLVQRCRCRYCKAPISWRYFTVELLTGAYFALLWVLKGPNIVTATSTSELLAPAVQFIEMALFSAMLIAIMFIDLDHMIIPDRFSLGAILLGIARDVIGIWITPPGEHPGQHLMRISIPLTNIEFPMLRSVVWMLVFGAGLLLIAELGSRAFKKEAMGGGDIKLMAAFGANLAAGAVVVGFFMAVFVGSIIGIALIATKLREKKAEIPFGPMLVAGALVAQIWGLRLWEAYLRYTGLI
jgi:leader peptidase (prepilin peptidase)/N-methyltransferase